MRWIASTAVVLAVLGAPSLASAGPRHYEGSGARSLAPFRLAQGATLRWQTSGGLIGGLLAVKMLNRRADIPNPQLVFSKARTGSIRLAPGRYVLRIDTLPGTRWQITIG